MYGLRVLGTLPYTGRPETAVDGTANYFCTLNGTSYFTAPTLGNLITGSPKFKIVIKKFSFNPNTTQAIFGQSGSTLSTRELLLRFNNNGLPLELFVGGLATNIATTAEITTAFGSLAMTCNEWAFELDGTTVRLYKDGVIVLNKGSLSRGTSRIDGQLFFVGAQCSSDMAGATTGTSIAPSGATFGDTQVYINDVLVRNYKNTNGNGMGYVDVLQPRPYALKFEANGSRYMALTQAIVIADNQDFEIEFECAFNNDNDFRLFGTTAGVNNRVILLKGTGATTVRLTPTNGNALDWSVTYTKTDFNVFRFKRVSNVVELFVNGVSQGTKTEAGGLNNITSLFTQGGFYGDSGTVRYLKFTIGNTLTNHFINTTGSGANWVDIVSGNQAVPVGTWPAVESRWIEYAHLQQRGTFTIDNNEWRQYIVFNVNSNVKEGGGISSAVINASGMGVALRRGGAVSSAALNTIGSGQSIRLGGAPVTFAYTLTSGNKTARRGGSVSTFTITAVGGGEVIKNTIAYTGGAAVTFTIGLTGGGTVLRRGGSLMMFAANAVGSGTVARRGGSVSSAVINASGSGVTRRNGGASASMAINLTSKALLRRNGGAVSSAVVNASGAGYTVRVGGADAEFTVVLVGGGDNVGQGYKPKVSAPVTSVTRNHASPLLSVGKQQRLTYNLEVKQKHRGQTCIL